TLSRLYHKLASELLYGWEITLINDGFAFIFTSLTKVILKKAGLPEELFNDLLCGEEGMESVEPVSSLVNLAESVRNNQKLSDFLQVIIQNKPDKLLAEINNQTEFPEFKKLFQQHLHKYGDRALSELKLEVDSFREQPAEL